MANEKVFGSEITRTFNKSDNNLYELLSVQLVNPLPAITNKYIPCDFVPRTDKYFIPKKKLRPKVKTVRDIRNLFEKDISSTVLIDIEKQQNILLRKIKSGSSKDEKTKLLARNMLKNDRPLSRTAWQMVININPDNCAHPSQYILWNGKCIQVNGSRGGKSKFIYKYDLGKRRASLLQRHNFRKSHSFGKKNLLKQSLNVKFNPGPLSTKKQLDISYQKYNIGNIELVHLPKPGLDILPEYGKRVENSIANFLHNLRDGDDVITDKWAEFAVSALGTDDNGRAVQLNRDSCVTFDLGYKYDQRRILMRRDGEKLNKKPTEKQICLPSNIDNDETINQEVKKMLDEMLNSVEISMMGNDIYTGEDCPREPDTEETNNSLQSQPKDKNKRKGQSELHRLDVTVIRLCDNQEKKEIGSCRKSFCTLGCICDSILCTFRLKNHCGRVECMFECKCDFDKYNLYGCLENDIIPGLVSLDKENNSKLSKEEQKFHQTVILSGEKSILLKSQRRNWKAPDKYAEFYSNMCLKTKKDNKRILSIVEAKLNCENIEPWCMIHNLYKCFCKGKFTEKVSEVVLTDETKAIDNEHMETKLHCSENVPSRSVSDPKTPHTDKNEHENKNFFTGKTDNYRNEQCARLIPFKKRKYDDVFYFNANKKIMELEKNDHGLRKRMMEILNIDESSNKKKPRNDSANIATIDLASSPVPSQISAENELSNESKDEPIDKPEGKVVDKPKDEPSKESNSEPKDVLNHETKEKLPTLYKDIKLVTDDVITTQFTSPTEQNLNMKLKAWLEPSLKIYKQRFGKGFFKKSLDPPKTGKIALYPWDFIVNRYHEKKNVFMVTNKKPFRIYMAVDSRNPLFNNCIDISSIEDLDSYPVSVKNIVTKEVNRLTDQLCILRGLNFCWELVGSIKKVNDRKSSESSSDVDERSTQSISSINSPTTAVSTLSPASENTKEQSKWFIMNVEKDFSEIQFHKRGFFVKYDSIIKAINVARASDKTVRLSSQKCNEGNGETQFGIYAIPSTDSYCVFIGPYEQIEPLGIETVKSTSPDKKMKTKGVWITTNKIDNFRVIDNPLSFMAQVNLEHGQILDDSSQDEPITDSEHDNNSAGAATDNSKVVKVVKPIKITKTNNFYHLTRFGYLKPIVVSPEKNISKTPIVLRNMHLEPDASTSSSSLLRRTSNTQVNERPFPNRPVAEVAPQVKVIEESKDTEKSPQVTPARKFEGGMFILKPEEINSRSLINSTDFGFTENIPAANNDIDMDIENFLANSVECCAPTADIYVISDDEDYCNNDVSDKKSWIDIWLISKNIRALGWIPGRQDTNGHLSFEFPGFKYTEFYPEQEAFAKITQVLARKIYIPENANFEWTVVHTKKQLGKIKQLKQEHLSSDYILTTHGLIHKSQLVERSKKLKTYSRNSTLMKCITKSRDDGGCNVESNVTKNLPEAAESDVSRENNDLVSEVTVKKEQLSDSLSMMSNDRRRRVSERLRSIISNENC